MTTHAPFSPSKLPKLAKCVGWQGGGNSADAERGTAIHAAIAEAINTFLKFGQADPATGEHAEIVDKAVRMFADEIYKGRENYVWHTEYKLDHDERGGTADVIGWDNAHAETVVVDWKTLGWAGRDDAGESLQLAGYATLIPWGETYTLYMGELERLKPSVVVYTRQQIDQIDCQIILLIEKAKANGNNPAAYKPGPVCDTCARVDCSARLAIVQTTALTVEGEAVDLKTADAETVAGLLATYDQRAELVEKWRAALRQRARELIEAGADVTGWELRERAGRRVWPDEGYAGQVAMTHNVDVTEIASPAEVERRMVCNGMKKTAAKGIIEGYTTKTTTKVLTRKDGE